MALVASPPTASLRHIHHRDQSRVLRTLCASRVHGALAVATQSVVAFFAAKYVRRADRFDQRRRDPCATAGPGAEVPLLPRHFVLGGFILVEGPLGARQDRVDGCRRDLVQTAFRGEEGFVVQGGSITLSVNS